MSSRGANRLRDRVTWRRGELVFVAALALACAAVTATVDFGPVRIAAGALLELVLSGYALSALIAAQRGFERAELVLCTLGASLVTAALGGLLLAVLPGHMGRTEWAVVLGAVTVLAAGGAIVRRERAEPGVYREEADPASVAGSDAGVDAVLGPAAESASLSGSEPGADAILGPRAALGPRAVLPPRAGVVVNATLALLAAGVAAGAIVIASHAAERTAGFTQLSSLPTSSSAHAGVLIRVRSHEHRASGYRLTVVEDRRRVRTEQIELPPGGEWHTRTAPVRPDTQRVVVSLYRAGERRRFLYTSYFPPAPEKRPAATRSSRLERIVERLPPIGAIG